MWSQCSHSEHVALVKRGQRTQMRWFGRFWLRILSPMWELCLDGVLAGDKMFCGGEFNLSGQ